MDCECYDCDCSDMYECENEGCADYCCDHVFEVTTADSDTSYNLPQAILTFAQTKTLLTDPLSSEIPKTSAYKDFTTKGHQTLVLCFAHKELDPVIQERMLRFVTSLNTAATIKADVYTVEKPDADGNYLRYGLNFLSDKPDPLTAEQYKKLKSSAMAREWKQIIFLEDPRG